MKTKPPTNKITLAQARRVLEVVDAGLCAGLGQPKPGQMCVEAAVCFALGQKHGDEPECVAASVRAFKIGLNDANWSSKAARAAGMRKLAIAQLGSKETLDEQKFAKALAELTIRRLVPAALRAAASVNPAHAVALEAAAMVCETEGTEVSARAACSAARAADSAAYSAARAAAHAAYSAARAADSAHSAAAHDACSAAAHAACSAAHAAASAASAAARAADSAADRMLNIAAEIGVQALRIAGAVGIKLMDKLIAP